MSYPRRLHLVELPDTLAVCRISLDSELEMWFLSEPFFVMLRSDDTLTIVCSQEKVPQEVQQERGWRALKIEGRFDFSETGILESVLKPLAEAGLGIFAVSSFETDYVLVKEGALDAVREALKRAGHTISRLEESPTG
jgi:uncharacterized protein